jgi:hypothetical protein
VRRRADDIEQQRLSPWKRVKGDVRARHQQHRRNSVVAVLAHGWNADGAEAGGARGGDQ